jgi:hypothetical protein
LQVVQTLHSVAVCRDEANSAVEGAERGFAAMRRKRCNLCGVWILYKRPGRTPPLLFCKACRAALADELDKRDRSKADPAVGSGAAPLDTQPHSR